jgi:NitT/TauT family transport system substrate-binding protein
MALVVATVPASAQSADGPTYTLRLGVFPNVTHAPGLVGIQGGLFQDALGPNVKIEVKTFNAGPTAITALFSGALDATFIGPNPAINGFQQSQGADVRIIAGSTSGGAFLVTKPSITKIADLEGKTIATPQLGNTQDVAIRAYLKAKGLSTDVSGGGDVSILPQSNATSLDAFKSGAIDGAWVPEPWASRLINEAGGRVLVDERDLWPDGRYVTTHLIASAKFLEDQPEVAKRLVKGQIAAVDFANEKRTVAERLVASAIKDSTGEVVNPATITNAWDNLEFTVDPISTSLAKSARDARAVGLLQPVNLKGIYDLRFLNKALKAAARPPVSSSVKVTSAKQAP